LCYASLHAACEAGVAAEIANGEMCERLLGATQRPYILVSILPNWYTLLICTLDWPYVCSLEMTRLK